MSGIRFDSISRSAIPVLDQKLKTVVANTDSANLLAFPTISAAGRTDMVDQCIAFNRPDSPNFTHASCRYLPNTFDYSNRATITISKSSNGSISVDSYNKMSYLTTQNTDTQTDYIWIAPAGLATYTSLLEFPATDSVWCNASNGIPGLCINNTKPTMRSDNFLHSVGYGYPHQQNERITTRLTSYVTVNYFIDMTRNNGASVAGPIKITDGSSVMHYGIISNSQALTFDQVGAILNDEPDKCRVVQFNDRDVFTDTSSTGTSYAYVRTDMYYQQQTGNYIFAYTPYVCIELHGFNYDPNFTDASLVFGLQYDILTYGVADDPEHGMYGMIYDNDDYNRSSIRVDTSTIPTETDTQLFTIKDFSIYARTTLNSISILLAKTSGESVTADILKQGYVQTAASYSGDMDHTESFTNVTIGSNKRSLCVYTVYDLAVGVKTFTDIAITYDTHILHFNIIKLPTDTAASGKQLVFHIVRDGT